MSDTSTPQRVEGATSQGSERFTDDERAAMRERAHEVRRGPRAAKADGEAELLAKIAVMADQDRVMAERIHSVVTAAAPELSARTWYGMPAYAKDGAIVCFFQSAQKFKTRYATLGFSDKANLDDGNIWATTYALAKLTRADEARIAALVKQAVS